MCALSCRQRESIGRSRVAPHHPTITCKQAPTGGRSDYPQLADYYATGESGFALNHTHRAAITFFLRNPHPFPMSSTRKNVLIFQGGWDGHQPVQCAELFAGKLTERGFHVEVTDTLKVLEDAERTDGGNRKLGWEFETVGRHLGDALLVA